MLEQLILLLYILLAFYRVGFNSLTVLSVSVFFFVSK